MKNLHTAVFMGMMALILSANGAYSQGFQNFFKSPTRVTGIGPALPPTNPGWEFKPTVNLPAFKIKKSVRDNAEYDVTFLASTGGGVTFQNTVWDTAKKKFKAKGVSVSPLIILLSGDTSNKDAILDLSWCGTIGFFNNTFQVGGGYDFGAISDGSKRWFGVLSIGINITNN